jgi:UDP-glucose 4-epimerase
MKTILVTGGLGYIGSHTVVQLLENDYKVIVIDNLSNSSSEVITKIKKITSKLFITIIGDIQNENLLTSIFKEHNIDFVIHFAGLKSVSESVKNPIEYYTNNISGTLTLISIMKKYNVNKLIFSSSATVYGGEINLPLSETLITGKNILSPYGKSKFIIEEMLKDLSDWNIVILRYFNPIGCHASGEIGENPKGIPNNLFPYILKVASGELSELNIFGNDYPTKDGTPIRDYIHVEDLANAHISSIKKLQDKGVYIYNVGTGIGYSVLEVVNTFQKINSVKIPLKFVERRKGDSVEIFANCKKIKEELGWKPKYTLEDMCRHGYYFVKKI